MTQKIPVSFELEIETEPGERWEFVRYDKPKKGEFYVNTRYGISLIATMASSDFEVEPQLILRSVEPLETECEWVFYDDGWLKSYQSYRGIAISPNGEIETSSNPFPAQLRDAVKILEYTENHGALPQTKKREG